MEKVLVVSMTNFWGGGESFIMSHLTNIENIEFYYLVASKELYSRLNSNAFLLEDSSVKEFSKKIGEITEKYEIKTVVLNGGRSFFIAPSIFKKNKVVGIRHTLNNYVNSKYRIPYLFLLNLSCCFMNKIVHVSKASQREQLFNRKNSLVIYNGVENRNSEVKEPNKEVVFTYVGRMSCNKGVKILIDAFNEILETEKNIKLLLVGSGEVDESYPHHEKIEFLGFYQDVSSFYKNTDYYVSLPNQENCSIAIIDSLSFGVPVITTDVGGNTELVINDYNGYIVERNKESVVKTVKNILSFNSDKYRFLSENAKNHYEKNFSLDEKKRFYKELLENL